MKKGNCKLMVYIVMLAVLALLVASCGAATPEVVKETVVVTRSSKETIIVEGTPQVVEKEVTKVVVETVVVETEKEVEKGTRRGHGGS